MTDLQDILAYLISVYPSRGDLSNARLTKLVYLADWKSAIQFGNQVSPIEWYFDNFGPFVRDVQATVQEHPAIFKTVLVENQFGDSKRRFDLVGSSYTPSLSPEAKQCLDFAVAATKSLRWDAFIKLIYSTYPIMSSDRYTTLDLVGKAKEYLSRSRSLPSDGKHF